VSAVETILGRLDEHRGGGQSHRSEAQPMYMTALALFTEFTLVTYGD
jgi:hypothetical protein